MAGDSDDDELVLLAVFGLVAFVAYQWFSESPASSPAPVGAGDLDSPTFSPAWDGSPAAVTPAPAWSPTSSPALGTGQMLEAMRVSPGGRAFTQTQEGLRLAAYPDAGVSSIGYGHRWAPGEPTTITPDEAAQYFESDIETAEAAVNSGVVVALTQSQFDALADFVFNVGVGAFAGSTLLRKLNAGDYAGAAAEFPKWNLSEGVVNSTLVARRARERAMFEGAWV